MNRAAGQLTIALLALIVVAVVAGHALVAVVNTADMSVSVNVATARTQVGVDLAAGASRLASTPTVIIVTAVSALGLVRARQRVAALFVVVAAAGAIVVSLSGTYLVTRPRPPVALPVDGLSSYSFPSEYATAATGLYLALALVMVSMAASSRQAIAGLVVAVLIALVVAVSRVYLGVDYPSDVVAGLLLGGAWAGVCWRVFSRIPASG